MSFGTALRKTNGKRGKMVVLAEVGEICLGLVSICVAAQLRGFGFALAALAQLWLLDDVKGVV